MNSLFVDEREAAKPPRFKPAAILALLSLAAVVAAVLIFAALAE